MSFPQKPQGPGPGSTAGTASGFGEADGYYSIPEKPLSSITSRRAGGNENSVYQQRATELSAPESGDQGNIAEDDHSGYESDDTTVTFLTARTHPIRQATPAGYRSAFSFSAANNLREQHYISTGSGNSGVDSRHDGHDLATRPGICTHANPITLGASASASTSHHEDRAGRALTPVAGPDPGLRSRPRNVDPDARASSRGRQLQHHRLGRPSPREISTSTSTSELGSPTPQLQLPPVPIIRSGSSTPNTRGPEWPQQVPSTTRARSPRPPPVYTGRAPEIPPVYVSAGGPPPYARIARQQCEPSSPDWPSLPSQSSSQTGRLLQQQSTTTVTSDDGPPSHGMHTLPPPRRPPPPPPRPQRQRQRSQPPAAREAVAPGQPPIARSGTHSAGVLSISEYDASDAVVPLRVGLATLLPGSSAEIEALRSNPDEHPRSFDCFPLPTPKASTFNSEFHEANTRTRPSTTSTSINTTAEIPRLDGASGSDGGDLTAGLFQLGTSAAPSAAPLTGTSLEGRYVNTTSSIIRSREFQNHLRQLARQMAEEQSNTAAVMAEVQMAFLRANRRQREVVERVGRASDRLPRSSSVPPTPGPETESEIESGTVPDTEPGTERSPGPEPNTGTNPCAHPYGAIGQEAGYGLRYVHPSQAHRNNTVKSNNHDHNNGDGNNPHPHQARDIGRSYAYDLGTRPEMEQDIQPPARTSSGVPSGMTLPALPVIVVQPATPVEQQPLRQPRAVGEGSPFSNVAVGSSVGSTGGRAPVDRSNNEGGQDPPRATTTTSRPLNPDARGFTPGWSPQGHHR